MTNAPPPKHNWAEINLALLAARDQGVRAEMLELLPMPGAAQKCIEYVVANLAQAAVALDSNLSLPTDSGDDPQVAELVMALRAIAAGNFPNGGNLIIAGDWQAAYGALQTIAKDALTLYEHGLAPKMEQFA